MNLFSIYNKLNKNKKIDNKYISNKYICYFVDNYKKDISFDDLYKKTIIFYLKENLEKLHIQKLLQKNLKIYQVDLNIALDLELNWGKIFYLDKIYENQEIKDIFYLKHKNYLSLDFKKLWIFFIIFLIISIFLSFLFFKKDREENKDTPITSNKNQQQNIINNNDNNEIIPKKSEHIENTDFDISWEEKEQKKEEIEDLLKQHNYTIKNFHPDLSYLVFQKNYSKNIIDELKNINWKKSDSEIIIQVNKNLPLIIPYWYYISYIWENVVLDIVDNKIINRKNVSSFEYWISKIKQNTKYFEEVEVYGKNTKFLTYKTEYQKNIWYSISDKIKQEINEVLLQNNNDKEKTLLYFFNYIKSKKYDLHHMRWDLEDSNYIEYIYYKDGLYCESSADLFFVISSYLWFETNFVNGYLELQEDLNWYYIWWFWHAWIEIKIWNKKYFFDPTSSWENVSWIDFWFNNGSIDDFYQTFFWEDNSINIPNIIKNNIFDKNKKEEIVIGIVKEIVNNSETSEQNYQKTIYKNQIYNYILENGIFEEILKNNEIKNDLDFFNFFIDKKSFWYEYIKENKNIFQKIKLQNNFQWSWIIDINKDAIKYINTPIPERYKDVFKNLNYNIIDNKLFNLVIILLILSIFFIYYIIFVSFLWNLFKINGSSAYCLGNILTWQNRKVSNFKINHSLKII